MPSIRSRLVASVARRLTGTAPARPPEDRPPTVHDAAPASPPRPSPPAPTTTTRRDSFYNPLSGLGGWGDSGSAARPDLERLPMEWSELDALVRFDGYAAKIVHLPAAEATRKGWTVTADDVPRHELEQIDERLQLQERMSDALSNARHYGGSLCWIVVEEDPDPRDFGNPILTLARPLDPTKVRRVSNVAVFDGTEFYAWEYDTDPRSPRFRQVKLWRVTPRSLPGNTREDIPGGGFTLHWTRAPYVAGQKCTMLQRQFNRGLDDSILEICFNAVRNRSSLDQSGAVMAQNWRVDTLKIGSLSAKMVGDQALDMLSQARAAIRSRGLLNAILLGPEDSYDSHNATFAGFGDLDTATQVTLAAVSGIPITLLFGQAPGGLNTDGESSRKNWANVISDIQQTRLHHVLRMIYLIAFSSRQGPTGGAIPSKWSIVFNPLDELSEKEDAEVQNLNAQTDLLYVEAGILPAAHVALSRFEAATYGRTIKPLPDDVAAPARRLTGTRRLPLPPPSDGALSMPVLDAAEGYDPPDAVGAEAARGIAWRSEYGRGGTEVGLARARQLIRGRPVPVRDLVQMRAFFARHGAMTRASGWTRDEPGYPSAGRIAWALWGGDVGREWAERILADLEAEAEEAGDAG